MSITRKHFEYLARKHANLIAVHERRMVVRDNRGEEYISYMIPTGYVEAMLINFFAEFNSNFDAGRFQGRVHQVLKEIENERS